MAATDKPAGVVAEVVAHLAVIFRYVLPGVIVVGSAYLAYPTWFKQLDLRCTGHLIVLGAITIAAGNIWFALNRYALHQAFDWLFYRLKVNGPPMKDQPKYYDDLADYVYKSSHVGEAAGKAQEHVRLRASAVLLILTLGEASMIISFFHASETIIEGRGSYFFFLGFAVFVAGLWQMVITRHIDWYIVERRGNVP